MSFVLPDCATCSCGNVLMWKEDPAQKITIQCTHCFSHQDFQGTMIWQRVYQSSQPRTSYSFRNAKYDITLPRASTSCPQCQSSNVVYHQEPTRFVYTCTHCDHVFH